MTLPKIICRNIELNPNTKTIAMGVLNVTPDSFSDGGEFLSPDAAIEQAKHLIKNGIHIIDIGGESSRPFSDPVPIEEELNRVVPIIHAIRAAGIQCPISIDTTKAKVAKAALDAGADIVNDISALRFDEEMASLIKERDVPVVLMHMKGTPRDMQIDPNYDDVIFEIKEFFKERINFCLAKGIREERIILDPGIGFGKRLEDNMDIINGLEEFASFELPILIGPSRKNFLGQITGQQEPKNRDNATCGAVIASILNGASMVRIHNPSCMMDAIKVADALKNRRKELSTWNC